MGGESSSNVSKIQENWVLNVKEQCVTQEYSFLLQAMGWFGKSKAGRCKAGFTKNTILLKDDSLFRFKGSASPLLAPLLISSLF
ncbi:MAG: phage Gp37/Gp68 family protein [Elusimicrobiota bacterium]|nr:phage Gp37/Gp68 family protein [Elusimicrobiota bacterium]